MEVTQAICKDMPSILPALIAAATAFLTYKIKLIDDRKNTNLEKYKNYIKRTILSPENKVSEERKRFDATEQDTWLDKDIPFHMIRRHKTNENDIAVLDYYQDYKDNEAEKIYVNCLIGVNIVYFLTYGLLKHIVWSKTILEFVILMLFFWLICIRRPGVSLINNPLINVDNSSKAKIQRDKTKIIIEKDFIEYKKKYLLEDGL
jgi:hypothetical protein